jgi:CBS domain-containing protein
MHRLLALQADRAIHQHIFYGHFSFNFVSARFNHLGLWVIPIPVIGGLIVGVMAKYGSPKIKGHGIPEAMEAVLVNRSRIQPRVAGSQNVVVTYPDETLHEASEKMLRYNIGRLPVVHRSDPRRIVGYLGRPGVMAARLRKFHEEYVREPGWFRGFRQTAN